MQMRTCPKCKRELGQSNLYAHYPKCGKPRKRIGGMLYASEETRKLVASMGGKAVSQDREHMSRIGKKGGLSVSQNKEHMSKLGKIGGAKVSQDREHMRRIGRIGRSKRK